MDGGVLGVGGGVRHGGVAVFADTGGVLGRDVGVLDTDLGAEYVFADDTGDLDREWKLSGSLVAARDVGVLESEWSSVGVLAFDGGVFKDARYSRDFFEADGEFLETADAITSGVLIAAVVTLVDDSVGKDDGVP